MSRSLRPWLQQRRRDALREDGAASTAESTAYRPGSRVQIMQVCDATHYLPARFTGAAVDAFQAEVPFLRFTQTRGAIITTERCRVTRAQVHVACAGTPWTGGEPPTGVLEIDAFTLLGSIGEPLHSGTLRDANA